jgi:hypothetical protein
MKLDGAIVETDESNYPKVQANLNKRLSLASSVDEHPSTTSLFMPPVFKEMYGSPVPLPDPSQLGIPSIH